MKPVFYLFSVILLLLFISGPIDAKIEKEVISTSAGLAALEVYGVAGIPLEVITGVPKLLPKSQVGKGIKVEVEDERVIIDIPVVIYYGFSIPVVAERLKMRVKDKIEEEFGLEVTLVNVLVEGIQIPQAREKEEEMEVKISQVAISTIAGLATLEVEGVIGIPEEIIGGVPKILEKAQVSKGVHIEIKDKKVDVKVPVIIFEGIDIKGLIEVIQSNIKKRIKELTGLEVSKVLVEVKGIHVSFEKKEEDKVSPKEDVVSEKVEEPEFKLEEGGKTTNEILKKEMEDLKEFLSIVKKVVERSEVEPAKEAFRKADIFFKNAKQAMEQKNYELTLRFIKKAKELALQATRITELKEVGK